MKIFDIHHHVGALGILAGDTENNVPSSIEGRIEYDYEIRSKKMKELGISQACLMPGNSYTMSKGIEDTREQNNLMAEYRNKHSDLFPVAMGIIEISQGEAALEEVDRIHEELALDGISFHHRFQGGTINDKLMWPILERAQKHGLKIFVHIISESQMEAPWRLEILADEFPEITFVALDAFSGISQGQWMTHIAKKHPNILFDTGCLASVGNDLRNFIHNHGTRRLLFGSTCYVTPENFSYPYPLIELQKMGLTEKELENIFYGNAIRYFGLEK